MRFNITLLKGDGIGPEIVDSAVGVLDAIGKRCGIEFTYSSPLIGGAAIDALGEPLPNETVETCLSADAVLLGAVGGPKWDMLSGDKRPEKALLGIRKAMGLYTNLRPAKLMSCLADRCPLARTESFDLLIVRELTGGIYFGKRGREMTADGEAAFDTEYYTENEIRRIGVAGFEAARKRKKRLHSVDKANILETSRLWRAVMHELSKSYPDVEYSDILVDNCAMQLVKNPAQFDVLVTSNMFGDILSDEAAQITGSIGLLPSASLGSGKRGLFEAIHGSAPDIAGLGIANPCATILSAALLLRYSLGLEAEAFLIENAVEEVILRKTATRDIFPDSGVTTKEFTDAVIDTILKGQDK